MTKPSPNHPRTANAVGELVTHHRTVARVLEDATAIAGDLLVDAYGHSWRVVPTRIGRGLEGVNVECRLPPALMDTVILVGLRPAPPEAEPDAAVRIERLTGGAAGASDPTKRKHMREV